MIIIEESIVCDMIDDIVMIVANHTLKTQLTAAMVFEAECLTKVGPMSRIHASFSAAAVGSVESMYSC